jgi:flagellar biosynthetic protein FliR
MAGKVMDMQVGFAIVNVMDPTSGQQMPLIGSFLYNLTVIIFLVVNGHHMLIDALFESFKMVPLLSMEMSLSLPLIIANFTTGIFLTGMKIAMPVTFSILLTNTGLGILARTMPQLNIFVVGLPMHIAIGLSMLMMLIPFYVLFLDVVFNEMYGNIGIALRALQ